MTTEQHDALLMQAVIGNYDALDFLKSLAMVFRVWDNLWDQDKPVEREFADKTFTDLAFELSRNPFFRKNRDALEAQIFIAWNAWSDANEWENDEDTTKKQCAYFIRDYCNEIVFLCAWLIGGRDHARKMSKIIRPLYLKEL